MPIITPLLAACFFLFSLFATAQNTDSEAEKILNQRHELYFKTTITDFSFLQQLSDMVSIDYFDAENAIAWCYANRQGFEAFLKTGQNYQILTPPGLMVEKSQINMLSQVDVENIESWDFYPTYEAYESMMQQFEEVFPHMFELVELETLPSGRKLLFGRISAQLDEVPQKPRFMYTSTMHGDETAGFNLLLRLIHYLLNNYGEDAMVTHLMDHLEIWICPNENPDGTYTTNNNTVIGATRGNAAGVDLNRNYPNPVSTPVPGNQPETQAMIDLVSMYDYVLSSNMHGGVELVNFPFDSWKSWQQKHADHNWWEFVMHEYVDTVRANAPANYMTGQGNGVTHGGDWYVIYGSRQDYMNYYAHLREFTLELSNSKLLPTALLPDHWEYNYRSFLNYMKQTLFGIHGTITDSHSGQSVRARIEIPQHDHFNSYVYSCPETGRFARPIEEGVYTLTVVADGYPDKTIENVAAQNYETQWLDIELDSNAAVWNESNSTQSLFYPNPANRSITFCKTITLQHAEIIDISGKILKQWEPAHRNSVLSVEDIPAGIYLLRVVTEDAVLTRKLIRK